MGIYYYRIFDKSFEWKFEAEEFIAKIKAKAKKFGLRINVKLLQPHVRFIGSVKFGEHKSKEESRIVGYTVRWFYKPPKPNFFKRLFAWL